MGSVPGQSPYWRQPFNFNVSLSHRSLLLSLFLSTPSLPPFLKAMKKCLWLRINEIKMPWSFLNLVPASHHAAPLVLLCFIPHPQIDYHWMTDGLLIVTLYSPPQPEQIIMVFFLSDMSFSFLKDERWLSKLVWLCPLD